MLTFCFVITNITISIFCLKTESSFQLNVLHFPGQCRGSRSTKKGAYMAGHTVDLHARVIALGNKGVKK